MKINVGCPYCFTPNYFNFTEDDFKDQMTTVYCDGEEGGCDRLLLVELPSFIRAKVYKVDDYNK